MDEEGKLGSRFRGNDEIQADPGAGSGMTSAPPPLPNPSPAEGERGSKKAPRWTIPFLRALERTGDVRASAEDAGIDWSTAYQRRKRHGDFANAWEAALVAHAERVEREEAGELADFSHVTPPQPSPSRGGSFLGGPPHRRGGSFPVTPPPSAVPLPTGFAGREELVGSGSQMKRAGHDRWSKAKEKIFFHELAATANVKRAATAAGVSPNAVYARRLRDRRFRSKWAAVLENGRASIEMHLVEVANRSFDPDELDTGAVEPRVSVAEAIRIVQTHGSRAERQELYDPYGEDAPTEQEIHEVHERLERKFRRVRDREMPALFAKGWSFDEEHDQLVPPGWVRVEPAREAEAVTE